jgi:subtilisin family serine protease
MMTDSLLAVGMLRTRLTRIAWAPVLLALSACGGGGGSAAPPSPPVASATANITQGQAPLTVNFDASKSTDPQNFPLMYAWTFGDGSTATGATVAHVFQNHGSYTASVAVSDGHNTTNSSPIAIAVTPAPPTVQPTAIPVNVMGVAPTTAAATVSATDRENLTLTYSLSSLPTAGTASIDPNTGAITYVVAGYASAPTDSFTVRVANLGASATGTVNVALNGDPLLVNQWHIQNVGQNAFATTFPVAGNDMNVTGAWTAGFSGKGIKVGVVDTGLEAAHEDLAANVDLTHSWNFITGTNDPTRQATDAGEDHGTQVAGIIGAVAFNGKGGRGVAYNATLRGYNLIATGAFSVANMATAMGSDPISADNDLFNASFESSQGFSLPTFSGAYQAITNTTLTLRANLGASIVNAAGNDFASWSGGPAGQCALANQFGVGCGDIAGDERRGGYAPIIVAALNADGVHATYSNTGSSVWISAPGGEYGGNNSVIPAQFFSQLGDPIDEIQPAIITTARTGCANASQAFFNQLPPVSMNTLDDQGANPLASQCQYTAQMNGTSSATPNTAGTVAMMLEANPKLSIRDIKYILAKTAKHVDPNFAGISSTTIISGSTIILEQGWVTNAAGFSFSNRYGFGGVDSSAAVAMAKTYTGFLPALQTSTGNYSFTATPTADVVPPDSATGGQITFAVSETFSTVEFVVVFVSLSSTPGMLCNQIELTSPSGTKSILMHAANGFQNSSVPLSRFESNAFYGEPVNGAWKLTFFDFCTASGTSTVLSNTQAQILSIEGH